MTSPIETDALIVGAGPVGLFQVFELGLLGISAHVVDALPKPGGQCIELYPDKPIYDIPALPVCGAGELVDRLLAQGKPFAPVFHLGQEVTTLERAADGAFDVATAAGTRFHARTVIVAGGVGAFQPRTLKVPGVDRHTGSQIHYKVADPALFAGRDIVILGGGDSALDWTLALQPRANSVLLIHRSQQFRAQPASVARMRALCDAEAMLFLEGNVTGVREAEGRLAGIDVKTADGVTRRVDAEHVLVFWGLLPKIGPIAKWGLTLDRQQLVVDTEKFQTSVPGVFAVGDINTYPGKKKLILSGFHEAALAAFGVHQHLKPTERVTLQYTTTSPALHKRLGVTVDLSDMT
jgi:thioredoxin reductase (NADPH)